MLVTSRQQPGLASETCSRVLGIRIQEDAMNAHPRHLVLAASLPFPLLGDHHPLQHRYRALLLSAAIVSITLHLCAAAAWMGERATHHELPVPGHQIVIRLDQYPPPSDRPRNENIVAQPPVALESAGIPEPVLDFQAPEESFPTNDEISRALDASSVSPLLQPQDQLIVQEKPAEALPSPTEFQAVEEAPALISMPAPVYPELARQAEAEGTVLLRVLVDKEGHVRDVIVVEGNEMLNGAAQAAARAAVFRPAMSQRHPVPVWIMFPIRFSLH
jgi:periplasmic protein TonB